MRESFFSNSPDAEEDALGVYDEEVELLRMILDRALASGGDIVFYESLFDRDKDELYECGIEDIESLKLKIASCMPDIILKDEYLYVKNDASIENDIKSAFRGCVIKSLSEIDFSLPYMNEYRIAEFMADSPDFICDEYGRYVSLEKIFISDRDVEVSSNRIISDIDNNGFYSSDSIICDRSAEMNMLSQDIIRNAMMRKCFDGFLKTRESAFKVLRRNC